MKIVLNNTRFVFATNLAGDPSKDRFASNKRVCNIIINDPDELEKLRTVASELGIRIRETAGNETYEPQPFVKALLQYRRADGSPCRAQPQVFLVRNGKEPLELDEEHVGMIDNIRVESIDVQLRTRPNLMNNSSSIVIDYMYVIPKEDANPFAAKYSSKHDDDDDDELPTF